MLHSALLLLFLPVCRFLRFPRNNPGPGEGGTFSIHRRDDEAEMWGPMPHAQQSGYSIPKIGRPIFYHYWC